MRRAAGDPADAVIDQDRGTIRKAS